jgi:hypothetical protein
VPPDGTESSKFTIGKVETVSEGLAAIKGWAPLLPELWFRGHSSERFALLPSVFRQGPNWGRVIDEAGLFRDFIREFAEMRTEHRSEFEWLTLMQHYSIPTRLLDWTASFLVALYFAVSERIDEDGTVYILNPAYLWVESTNVLTPLLTAQIESHNWQSLVLRLAAASRQLFPGAVSLNGIDCAAVESDPFQQVDAMGRPHEIQSLSHRRKTSRYRNAVTGMISDELDEDLTRHLSTVIALRPPKLNPRLIAQHGMFTFHGGKLLEGRQAIPAMPLEQISESDSLAALAVPAGAKRALIQELRRSGIYEAVLFPEMEYRAREICAQRVTTYVKRD